MTKSKATLPTVSIIVPSLGRLDLMRQCLQMVREQIPREAIAGVVPVLQKWSDRDLTLLANEYGDLIAHQELFAGAIPFAQAINAGVRNSPVSSHVLLLNNDVQLEPGFWHGMMEMVSHGYEIAGAKLLYPDRTIQHFGKWFTLDFYPFHVLRHQPEDTPEAMQPRPFPCVTAACMLVRRDIWEELDGMDEGYRNGFEDDDFCLRTKECGANIGVHPEALAIHLESQTTGMDNENKEVQYKRFREIWVNTGRISWATGMHVGWRVR
jgi:O-antigen biosynthesis protein